MGAEPRTGLGFAPPVPGQPQTDTGRKAFRIHGLALLDDVMGIEAEAVAQVKAELAKKVRDIEPDFALIHRAAVLALLEAELPQTAQEMTDA